MTQFEEKNKSLISDFNRFQDWESKYAHIIQIGKRAEGLADSDKIEDLKVKGCQSQVWLKASLNSSGECIFKGDSDALIVKGLVTIITNLYSNEKPDVILKSEPFFLKEIGFDVGLSPSRSNGLHSMIKQIKYYATAYQYLLNQKKS